MFQKTIDDMRGGVTAALRATTFVGAAVLTTFVTLCFLCAACFVYIFDRYGLIEACLAGAGVFFLATIVIVVVYAVLRRRARKPVEVAKSTVQTALADPMVIAAGLQIVRAIGIKRLIPLLAIGGLGLGLMARPPARSQQKDGTKR
jgi:hypothetical protein